MKFDSSSSEESISDNMLPKHNKIRLNSNHMIENAYCLDSSPLTSEIDEAHDVGHDESRFCIDELIPSPEVPILQNGSIENTTNVVPAHINTFQNGCTTTSSAEDLLEDNCATVNLSQAVHSSEIVSTNYFNNSIIPNFFCGNNFENDLRKWAIASKVPHVKIRLLLSMLKLYKIDVPVDPRTLLRTPRTSEAKECNYGEYMHFGLTESIKNILNKNIDIRLPEILNLGIGIDDVPTYKGISITLILGCIDEVKEVFIIGMISNTFSKYTYISFAKV